MARPDLTAQRLRELLHYDPETGIFRWKMTFKCVKTGSVAGGLKNGYVSIKIDGVFYRAHRLAWMFIHGVWPLGQIDHINHNTEDNRLVNLRDVDKSTNLHNVIKPRPESKSGVKGVARRGKKWSANIQVRGTRICLGCFETCEQASLAYQTYRMTHCATPLMATRPSV